MLGWGASSKPSINCGAGTGRLGLVVVEEGQLRRRGDATERRAGLGWFDFRRAGGSAAHGDL